MKAFLAFCDECGWSSRTTSQAFADYAFRQHSCRKKRARDRSAQRRRNREARVDRTPKPCLHKVARHEHGSHACYCLDFCRCPPCTRANSEYEADRARRRAYGREDLVDADPVRMHVRALMAAGIGYKRVGEMAGVSHGAMTKLLYGVTSGGVEQRRPPARRVRRATAAALLGVRLVPVAGGVKVDPTGTMRRLRALCALGWSVARLAAQFDLDRQVLDAALNGTRPTTTQRTATAVRAMYEAIGDSRPIGSSPGELRAITIAARRAAAHGWAPPIAWDDHSIDDPRATAAPIDAPDTHRGVDEVAVARAMAGDRIQLTRAERWLAVERLAAQGLSDAAIGGLLHVTAKTVLRDRQQLDIESRWVA